MTCSSAVGSHPPVSVASTSSATSRSAACSAMDLARIASTPSSCSKSGRPATPDLAPDEALGTLAERYFASHGPARLQDFAWWSGLYAQEAQRAVAIAGAKLRQERRRSTTWFSGAEERPRGLRRPLAMILPPWDEYLVAYRDRSAAVGHLSGERGKRGDLVGKPLLIVDGRVRGAWRRSLGPTTVRVELDPWTPLSTAERDAAERAAARYAEFMLRNLELRGLPIVGDRAARSLPQRSPAAPGSDRGGDPGSSRPVRHRGTRPGSGREPRP